MNKLALRASLWSLVKLGIIDKPSITYSFRIIYLLQYSEKGCLGNCVFCAQSWGNRVNKSFLSRITWPKVDLEKVLEKLRRKQGEIDRICIQSIIKPYYLDEILEILEAIRSEGIKTPISLAITPIPKRVLRKIKGYGVDYIGVGLDAGSPEVFEKVGKPYTWRIYIDFIRDSLEVFGHRHVVVHLIVGLGENRIDLYHTMNRIISMGGDIALFAYTPITLRITSSTIDIHEYRRAQIVRYLLLKGYKLADIIDDRGRIRRPLLEEMIKEIDRFYDAFSTSGCLYCNRPFYNESPRGPFYNIYDRAHFFHYKNRLLKELKELINIDQ